MITARRVSINSGINEAANDDGLKAKAGGKFGSGRSPICPAPATPIPAPFVLPEPDARACVPVIFVNNHTGGWWIVVAVMSVPADRPGANNRRRRTDRGKSQDACAHCGAEQSL